jgi:very-short-patch-repair endonuclease
LSFSNPLSAAGEERVDERSNVGVSPAGLFTHPQPLSATAKRGVLAHQPNYYGVERISIEISCEGNNLLYLTMPSIITLCRELRQRETEAEKLLWQHLRNRNLAGQKFLRQYPICVQNIFGRNLYYIPDFYCHKAKLVVEADGPIHLFKKDYDKNRDEVLTALGLKILRFENVTILNNTQYVLDEIEKYLR